MYLIRTEAQQETSRTMKTHIVKSITMMSNRIHIPLDAMAFIYFTIYAAFRHAIEAKQWATTSSEVSSNLNNNN